MYELVSRDRLFFDQYRYCLRFKFAHSGRMRILNQYKVEQSCEWANHASTITGSYVKPVSDAQLQNILLMIDTINAVSVPFKRIVYTEWQHFYTNDPGFFGQLTSVPEVQYVSYHEADVNQPRDTVILQHSDYAWRSYFRERWYSSEQLTLLCNFIVSRPQQFNITQNWRKRLSDRYCWITRSFFVDHHDAKDVTMLNLVLPGCVRKTMPIVQKC